MLDRFVRLCEIGSPTGEEREVADAVLDELRASGVDVAEDASATPAQAGAGNLIARVPGRTDRWLSFFAHLDTVPHEGPIEVVRADGAFRSAGDTILGAGSARWRIASSIRTVTAALLSAPRRTGYAGRRSSISRRCGPRSAMSSITRRRSGR